MVRGAPVSSTVANGTSVSDCLDMSLDDVIALTANTGKAKRQGNRRVKGGLAFSKHDDTRGFQGRAVHVNGWGYRKDRGFRGQERWRGRPAGAQRKQPAWFEPLPIEDDGLELEDAEIIMSDGEIPSRPSMRRRIMEQRRLAFAGPPRPRRSAAAERRHVRVAGLDYSILTSDLEELFQSVGPIEKCWIDFDRTDRSLGTGGVIFQSAADARIAVETFNGRLIDGQPLELELVVRPPQIRR